MSLARVLVSSAVRALPRASSATVARVSLPASTLAFRALSTSRRNLQDEFGQLQPEPYRRVTTEPKKILFVGNVPWSATPQELANVFFQFGTIEDIRMQMDAAGRPRGFAHITFESIESAQKAVQSIQETPVFFAGRNLRVDYAQGISFSNDPKAYPPSANLLIQDWDGDEVAVQQLFGSFTRKISRIHIVRDKNTGESRRLAFVEFFDEESATAALNELQGKELRNGEVVRLRYATPRAQIRSNAQERYE